MILVQCAKDSKAPCLIRSLVRGPADAAQLLNIEELIDLKKDQLLLWWCRAVLDSQVFVFWDPYLPVPDLIHPWQLTDAASDAWHVESISLQQLVVDSFATKDCCCLGKEKIDCGAFCIGAFGHVACWIVKICFRVFNINKIKHNEEAQSILVRESGRS